MLKHLKINVLFLFLLLIGISCSKKDNGSSNGAISSNYANAIQLNQGSYWIYDTGDSAWMSNDTIVNGISYHKKRHTKGTAELLRDSSGFIIDVTGKKVFSSTDFKDTLWKAYGDFGKMYSPDTSVTVPAGTFKAVIYRATSNNAFPGFITEADYVNNVGVIRQIRTDNISFTIEKLIRYKLK